MKKTWKHRLAAFGTAGALALAMAPMAAMADEEPTSSDLGLDSTITVSGLDAGDSAEYYQIIERDATTGEWVFTSAVDNKGGEKDGIIDGTESIQFNGHNGLKVEDLRVKKYNIKADGTSEEIDPVDYEVITAAMANYIIGALQQNNKTTADGTMTVTGTTATKTFTATDPRTDTYAGLYMVVAIPAKKDVIYKPVFVSADYDANDGTDRLALTEKKKNSTGATDYQDQSGVFKKSRLTLDKESGTADDRQNDVKVGETVPFTIKTNLPTYTKNYTNPTFVITDQLTEGLELNAGTIEVKVGTAVKNTKGESKVMKGSTAVATIEENTDLDGFTVTFDNKDYLYEEVGNPEIVITYTAKVTTDHAGEQVNQMDNNATLEFSNNPKNASSKGKLEDKTRHYTFDIDGNVFGSGSATTPGKTSELRKVALDADGNVIEKMTTTELGEEKAYDLAEWLKDAEFELTQTKYYATSDTGELTLKDVDDASAKVKFNSDGIRDANGSTVIKSDENGYIPMKGLDAGIYQLKETKAPLGYSFDPSKVYTITIKPTYALDEDENLILSEYEVKIEFTDEKNVKQESVSTYTAGTDADDNPISFLNDAGEQIGEANEDASIDVSEDNSTTLIINKQLGLLPATGGSGILFYVAIGAAIMALAIVLSRRGRKSATPAHGVTA